MKNPLFLVALFVPAAVLFFSLKTCRDRVNFFYASSSFRKKEKAASVFRVKFICLSLLWAAGMALLVFSLTSPFFLQDETFAQKSAAGDAYFSKDTVLAVDISRSMLADDGGKSRLERAREAASGIVAAGKGRFALVIFKGSSHVLLPMTASHGSVLSALESLGPEVFSETGTDVGSAVLKSLEALPFHEKTEKSIYLFTDGEEPEKGCFPACREEIAEMLEQENVSLFVVPPLVKKSSAIPGTEIVSTPDLKMIEQLADLPGAAVLQYRDINEGSLVSARIVSDRNSRHDLAWFFSASGFLLVLTAVFSRGIKWQGLF